MHAMSSSLLTPTSSAFTYRRGDPWFDDGNLILHTEDRTIFRVHRGVLARQSEIFRSMLDVPQPGATEGLGVNAEMEPEPEVIEGCQVVRMYDHPLELSNLLKAIYDGVTFQNRNLDDFFLLAGILRLSTKYFINNLRSQALSHLTRIWAYTLKGHDTMVDMALNSPINNNVSGNGAISFPYVHPIHVLNLAREVNLRIIIPSAIYFLSLYPFSDLVRADHPKLIVEHPSKPSSLLSYEDIQNYTLLFQHRIDLMLDFNRRFCGERKPSEHCLNAPQAYQILRTQSNTSDRSPCLLAFTRLTFTMSKSWKPRTAPLHWMLQAVQQLDGDANACDVCKRQFRQDVHAHRESIWNGLPGVIALPDWEVLLADLSSEA